MAAASLPPAALVRITADDTGGGMQLTATTPCSSHRWNDAARSVGATMNVTTSGTRPSVKPWISAWSGRFATAPASCRGFSATPERKKIKNTAPYFTVTWAGND